MKISFIIPFRDREDIRLSNCIESLLEQTYEDIEVVVSVFGGNFPSFVKKYDTRVRVIHTQTEEIWNRSKALNKGINYATGDIIVCTDVDAIFDTWTAEKTLAIFRHNPNAFVYTNIFMMAEEDWFNHKHRPISNFDLHYFIRPNNLFSMVGTGIFQAMSKENWYKLGGFKENYKGWGCEDIDLFRRALKICDVVKLEGCIILHQWHKSVLDVAKEHNDKELLNSVESNYNLKGLGQGVGDL